MVDRQDIGSWLQGPGSRNPDAQPPGTRLGLPAEGAGSVAGVGRRALAIVVDFFLCELIATLFGFRFGRATGDVRDFVPLMVFAVENLLLVGSVGSTVGHRLLGLRVVRVDGHGLPGPVRALVRSVLLCLVVPAVIWDRDQRGLHDRFAGTVLVRI
ncbi:MAG: RDD family protein [Actinomycetales bacterium]